MTKEYVELDDRVRIVFENCPDLGEEETKDAFLELLSLLGSWANLIVERMITYIEGQINGVDHDDVLAEMLLLTEHVELTNYKELKSDVWTLRSDPSIPGLGVYFQLNGYSKSRVYFELKPFGFVPRYGLS